MIVLKNVCAGYEKKRVLHEVSLSLKPGKIIALIGPNGCGKSTLLKTLVRIHPHTDGEILVNEKNISEFSARNLAKEIAYLAQNKQIPDCSVLRMVLHGRFAYLHYPRRYRKEDFEIARKALEWVGLAHLENVNMQHLSGGMQQKVYIAMALAQDANTILMDEPTTYLDIAHQLRLMELAKQLAAEGKAVVIVLHDLSQALRTADEVIVLQDGKVAINGTPEEVYESGKLQDVFQVDVKRIQLENKWHYICDLQ